MRDETKKLFAAPWTSTSECYVEDTNGFVIAKCNLPQIANCITHLPELYEALIDTNLDFCQKCFHESRWSIESAPSADAFIEHGCPKINRSSIIGCRRDHFWKLLKQVRDGK